MVAKSRNIRLFYDIDLIFEAFRLRDFSVWITNLNHTGN